MATRVEEAIHPWRWRFLTAWIVVFSALTAYAIWQTDRQSDKNDHRFCDVTTSFLTSEIQLRDQLNRGDLIEIGMRQDVQKAARNATYVFTLAPPSRVLQEPVREAIINFLQAIDDLQGAQIRLGQAALDKTDVFTDRLAQLRRRLRCPD